jgi:predicted RNase H-like HicB family nuclease
MSKIYNFTVLYIPAEEGGYVAVCPALPGLVTEGDSLDDAREMAKDAIKLYLEGLLADGTPIPTDPITSHNVPVIESLTGTFDTEWKCDQCGSLNKVTAKECINCHDPKSKAT